MAGVGGKARGKGPYLQNALGQGCSVIRFEKATTKGPLPPAKRALRPNRVVFKTPAFGYLRRQITNTSLAIGFK